MSMILTGIVTTYYFQKKIKIEVLNQQESVLNKTDKFIEETYRFERNIIENYPIFSDWNKYNKIMQLRKYLYKYHIKIARKYGIGPISKDEKIEEYVKSGKLVEVGKSDFYYFYGVPKKYRFLTNDTKKAVEIVAEEFNKNIAKHAPGIKVKIAVSSMLRPDKYQAVLSNTNVNAIGESTHSYGVSFDIFYEDYYVYFEESNGGDIEDQLYNKLRVRMGYVLGDSLRRQFSAILAETLLDLQNKGVIYAIWERNQRCFHVSIAKPL